jgi:hypothetical protein
MKMLKAGLKIGLRYTKDIILMPLDIEAFDLK